MLTGFIMLLQIILYNYPGISVYAEEIGKSFYDSFDDKSQWTDLLGSWNIENESETNNILTQTLTDTGNSSTRNEMRIAITDRVWDDAIYEFDVRYAGASLKNDMSNWFGVSFRKDDSNTSWRNPDGYMLYWRINGKMDMGKGGASGLMGVSEAETGGAHSVNASEIGSWRHLKIVNVGNNIKVFTDNNPNPIYNWTDESNHAQSGYFTLNASASAWSFDNLHVRVDGDLIKAKGFYDLDTGEGSDEGGVVSIPVVLFNKTVSAVKLLDGNKNLVKELQMRL